MGSIITTLILLISSILVVINAVARIINPVSVNYNGMIILAIIGVIVNFLATYFTKDGESLNEKSVNLHMLEDVLGWLAVLIGAIIMRFTNLLLIDPILSIVVAVFIFINALKNMKEILDLFLEKTPKDIDVNELKTHLLKIKEAEDIHHIHIWSIDGNDVLATLHVVSNKSDKKLKEKIREELNKFGINHVTIELENPKDECNEKTCEVSKNKQIKHHHHH